MADPMRIRAALAGEETTVRVLMSHPMETGLRRDAAGALVPAHYIRDVQATHNGRTVLRAAFSTAVSQNPFILFKFRGAARGDKVSIRWVDNRGATRTDEATIT
ncbi:thiosulfate oxidation carrier complex protein SoxZ [Hydrogenophaga sp.]|uniref:thiosulfate oxidation carrier complex protein SoxZ n=1 Tax=Hydrogenophaga sp. TaxID=1904254 RepID=UPI0019C41007|nr:thiosulfate oxidation carrier complex protein SoxZ [Hydrogenophaga sp.]MBD3893773.1 thiosulfate oxidation carrier complex protein SoxZ [Hydrogenophaga sp.]